MARIAKPFKPDEMVSYTHPLVGGSIRVWIKSVYSTRTGDRVLVRDKEGREMRVRPSQLRRR